MKWPYTVNVGGITFYCMEYVLACRRDAYRNGKLVGFVLGIVGSIVGQVIARTWFL
jgi:uncharacterized membrane protein YeaQ/YmgE (transglycosylase-associated protein family)